jgi:hypothetical protein
VNRKEQVGIHVKLIDFISHTEPFQASYLILHLKSCIHFPKGNPHKCFSSHKIWIHPGKRRGSEILKEAHWPSRSYWIEWFVLSAKGQGTTQSLRSRGKQEGHKREWRHNPLLNTTHPCVRTMGGQRLCTERSHHPSTQRWRGSNLHHVVSFSCLGISDVFRNIVQS